MTNYERRKRGQASEEVLFLGHCGNDRQEHSADRKGGDRACGHILPAVGVLSGTDAGSG